MARDADECGASTRREWMKYGGAVIAGGLLAGCTGGESSGGGANGSTDSENGTRETEAGGTTGNETAEENSSAEGDGSGSYSVTMEPVGSVEFEEVPERWVPFTGDYADMGVALGRADGLAGIGVPERFASHYYEELPGVAVDKDALTRLYRDGTGKEVFYELDADLHVIDPNFVINRLQWSQGDVEEIRENVAPFLGNTIFTHVYDWHDYRYYSLYEAFEKIAAVFDERARYEAFRSYHDEVVGAVQSRLPSSRPSVAVVYPAEIPPESFYPYLIGKGTASKQWRDLGVEDALARSGVTDAQAGGGTIDYETLLEIDPDAIAVRIQGEISDEYFRENVLAPMRRHEVASELTAVENDRVFYGGVTYQGPIIHLFQLEEAAQGTYPEEFGGERLFDRQRVSDVINGSA